MVGPAPHPDMVSAAASLDTAVDAAVVAKVPTAGGFFFSKPMALIETLLTTVHDTSGLPWWLTIAATTVSVRLLLVPLQIYQSKSVAQMAAIKPQMDELTAKMRASAEKGTEKGYADAEKARLDLAALMAHHNVSPWKSMVGAFAQIPLWISFFFTMRHMVRAGGGLGLDTGGALWFTDLTSRDPYYVLPLVCGASFYGMVTLGDAGQAPGAKLDARQEQMKMFMKGVAVLMVPTTAWFESGVFVYWISTNAITVLQTITLRQPLVRHAVGMPPLPGVSPAVSGLLGMSPQASTAVTPPAQKLEVALGGSAVPAPKKKRKKRR